MVMESYVRKIELDGACNVRDIGGYASADGGSVMRGRLFRADGLHKLSEADRGELLGRGVKLVIDLRSDHELAAKPNVFAQSAELRYRNISLLNPALPETASPRTLGDLYVSMLDGAGEQLREVFGLIAIEPDAVLFHCAAGKDRTGVVAALLLQLAGVEDRAIVADYAETGLNLAPVMNELRADRPEAVPADLYEMFLGSDPSNMETMLAHLHSRYGGAEPYLRSIGVTEAELASLRNKLSGV